MYVEPASGQHLALRDHLLATFEQLAPHAAARGADSALALLRADVQAGRNDARWLRERQAQERLLGDVIRQAGLRFRGGQP